MKLIYDVQYLCVDEGSGSEPQEISGMSARRLLLLWEIVCVGKGE